MLTLQNNFPPMSSVPNFKWAEYSKPELLALNIPSTEIQCTYINWQSLWNVVSRTGVHYDVSMYRYLQSQLWASFCWPERIFRRTKQLEMNHILSSVLVCRHVPPYVVDTRLNDAVSSWLCCQTWEMMPSSSDGLRVLCDAVSDGFYSNDPVICSQGLWTLPCYVDTGWKPLH